MLCNTKSLAVAVMALALLAAVPAAVSAAEPKLKVVLPLTVKPEGTVSYTVTADFGEPKTYYGTAAGDRVRLMSISSAWGSTPSDPTFVSASGNTWTFAGTMLAPAREAVIVDIRWQLFVGGVAGPTALGDVEITCSDLVFCNGEERYVRGQCVASPVLPCTSPSGDPCDTFTCFENNKTCSRRPVGGPSCAKCLASACKPSCPKGVTCGDDGCGGSCGPACAAGTFCIGGTCQAVSALGSCANPAPLFGTFSEVPVDGITTAVFGDSSSTGIDIAQPVCQSPGIAEYVYGFSIPQAVGGFMGFEIRMTGADGSNYLDTLLAVHDANCQPFVLTAADRLCSDDQTPPGNVASRCDGGLPPGQYTLIATAYSAPNLAPFRLEVKFFPNCVPKCEGRFCGTDSCGNGTCGSCPSGYDCFFGRCQLNPCVPQCQSRHCGSDGCGGQCGVCKDKKVCDEQSGQCVPVTDCNWYEPVCQGKNGNGWSWGPQDTYCGSDCQWHRTDEPTADLIPNTESEVLPTIQFQRLQFEDTSCAVNEGCVLGTGKRLLMRFDTKVHNIGSATFVGPDIRKRPDLFTWANCHQHYHFIGFARFNLYDWPSGNNLILPGSKLSYCMEDAEQFLEGSQVPCDAQFDCLHQGIPHGRSDNYPGSLDCQWLDITDLPQKGMWVTYEVCVNIRRSIFEGNMHNNCRRFPIYLPNIPESVEMVSYADMMNSPYGPPTPAPSVAEPGSTSTTGASAAQGASVNVAMVAGAAAAGVVVLAIGAAGVLGRNRRGRARRTPEDVAAASAHHQSASNASDLDCNVGDLHAVQQAYAVAAGAEQ